MFTLIKTDEKHLGGPCSNPGDNLLTENAKRILRKLFGIEISLEYCFKEYSKEIVNEINKSQIVFFTVPTYSDNAVELYKKLVSEITCPIIPLSGSVLLPPPSRKSSKLSLFDDFSNYKISEESKEIVRKVNGYSEYIPCREFLTEYILRNNGFDNAFYVGDLGMYEQGDCLKKMQNKKEIQKILFTVGHYSQYTEQLISVLGYLKESFPNARIIYSTHANYISPTVKEFIDKYRLEIVDTSFDEAKMNFYQECDLHVGYRLHGHIKCLSCGVPSILIAEDSRSSGFKCTLGNIGIFLGYGGRPNIWNVVGIRKFKDVKPAEQLIAEIDEFLQLNISTNFSSYKIIPDIFRLGYNNLVSYLTKTVTPLLSNR